MRLSGASLCALAALLASTSVSLAIAQPRVAPPRHAEPSVPTLAADTLAKLKSADPAQIRSALDDVRMTAKGGGPAVPAIVDLLHRGMNAPLTKAAIETLGDVEAEAASEAIAPYARHRSLLIRDAAVRALAQTKGPHATKALRLALSDRELPVRQNALAGLVALKAKDAVPELFLALEHRIPKTSAAIGELCSGVECEQLAGRLGQLPFDTLANGLQAILFRPQHEVGDDTKVKIVDRLRESATSEANGFLKDAQKSWPRDGSKRVKQAIDQAVIGTTR